MYCLCVNVYCHRVTTQLQLINIYIKTFAFDTASVSLNLFDVHRYCSVQAAQDGLFLKKKKSVMRRNADPRHGRDIICRVKSCHFFHLFTCTVECLIGGGYSLLVGRRECVWYSSLLPHSFTVTLTSFSGKWN